MQPQYQHTQIGWINRTLSVVLAVAFVVGLFLPGIPGITFLGLGLAAVAMHIFSSLTVVVYADRVRCWFGPGLVYRTLSIDDIKGVKRVRNSVFHGWGVRYIGNGWMFNVTGLDAVELTLASGRRFRIGTDDPVELEAAIWRAASLPD